MNILDTIIAAKHQEVAQKKLVSSESALRVMEHFRRPCLSLKDSLLKPGATGIIAEFKRKSPSKGLINAGADVASITASYTAFGASGLSILTDSEFFGGSQQDLLVGRKNQLPILRKDFIVDPYQVTESKALGADVILLIAACLTANEVNQLARFAKELGLEVLLELHEEEELDRLCDSIDLVGINNRNLKTFEVDIDRSIRLSSMIPAEKIKIAESGIEDPASIHNFRQAGYMGFLVGEYFMKDADPGKAFQDFVGNLPS